jgi:hypothetical protein
MRLTVIWIAFMIIGSIFGLVIAEIGVRIFTPQQLILIRPDVFVPTNDGLGYKHNVNLDTMINTGEREVRLITDENGYRIDSKDRAEPTIRILALGDSMLEALQVDYKQIMTSLLEERLSRELGKRVEITNTGVSCYNPNHYLITARHELPRNHYDLVLVFVYSLNDVVSSRVEHFPPRQKVTRNALRLPKNLSHREIIDAFLYPLNDFLEERSHLWVLFKDRASVLLGRMGLPAKDNITFPSENLILSSSANSSSWAVTADVLADIEAEGKKYDIRTVFVLLSAFYQIYETDFERGVQASGIDRTQVDLYQPQRLLTVELERRGLIVIDMLNAMREAKDRGSKGLWGKIDKHLSPDGHRVVADYLMPQLSNYLKK